MSELGRFILPTVLVALMVLASSSSVLASTELFYDDAGAELGIRTGAHQYLAVKFSLPSGWSSANLLAVAYDIDNYPTAFSVHIFGGDGATELLVPALLVTPSATVWFNVDLEGYNIVVSGDFWVAIEFQTSDQPWIGFDTSPPTAGRSYFGTPGSWASETGGNIMIRAAVEQILAPTPVGGIAFPTNKLAILAPYLALIGLIGAVTAAVTVTRRRKT